MREREVWVPGGDRPLAERFGWLLATGRVREALSWLPEPSERGIMTDGWDPLPFEFGRATTPEEEAR